MKYRYVEGLTSDVMFEAYGKSLKELFENSAYALFESICHMDKVKAKNAIEIEAEADNEEDLLVKWLTELIAAVDINEMFFSKFEVTQISETKVKGKIYGELLVPEKGETVVKAVTRYKYKFEKNKKGYKAVVSLDV